VTERTTVLICEDHAVFREGLRSIFVRERDINVIGEAEDAEVAAKMVALLRPAVVILSLSLPGFTPFERVKDFMHVSPESRILAMGMFEDEEVSDRCFENGCSGYLLKGVPVTQLLLAIRLVGSQTSFVDPRSLRVLAANEASHPQPRTPGRASSREQEVLILLAEGFSYKEIAARLHVSVKTVDSHKYNVMRKLGIDTRAGLIRFAIKERLIEM